MDDVEKKKLKRLLTNIRDACVEAGRPVEPVPVDLGMVERWAHDALQVLDNFLGEEAGKPLIIIAGNPEQADQWARGRKLEPRDYIHANSAEDIRGRWGYKFVTVGTYYERKDFRSIEGALIDQNCKRFSE